MKEKQESVIHLDFTLTDHNNPAALYFLLLKEVGVILHCSFLESKKRKKKKLK